MPDLQIWTRGLDLQQLDGANLGTQGFTNVCNREVPNLLVCRHGSGDLFFFLLLIESQRNSGDE